MGRSTEEAGETRWREGSLVLGASNVARNEVIDVGLGTPPKIQELQRKLLTKAKCEPKYRFYTLYDKVYRPDILEHAYRLAKANGGAPGVDGQTFKDIEAYGEERFVEELARELKEERYRPEAVRRVMIPKDNGGERPLGIPTVRDRTVQGAAKLVLEPIFEADFTDNAHGYRPGHSAGQAVREVHEALKSGTTDVVDADVTKFFDTIPHSELMRSVARRVSDGRMLHLIKMWLEAPIEETNDRGQKQRRDSGGKGTPQGGVLSPLLANIYMRRFLKAWEQGGYEQKLSARIVNYADDFVVLCRGTARQALSVARGILSRIGLTLNEAKTRTCNAWQDTFDFLGYTFGATPSQFGGQPYLAVRPSKKSIARLKDAIRERTGPATLWQPPEYLIGTLNALLRGWGQYFSYGTIGRAYTVIDHHVLDRVTRWWSRKFKRRGRREWVSPRHLHDELGLMNYSRLMALARGPR